MDELMLVYKVRTDFNEFLVKREHVVHGLLVNDLQVKVVEDLDLLLLIVYFNFIQTSFQLLRFFMCVITSHLLVYFFGNIFVHSWLAETAVESWHARTRGESARVETLIEFIAFDIYWISFVRVLGRIFINLFL